MAEVGGLDISRLEYLKSLTPRVFLVDEVTFYDTWDAYYKTTTEDEEKRAEEWEAPRTREEEKRTVRDKEKRTTTSKDDEKRAKGVRDEEKRADSSPERPAKALRYGPQTIAKDKEPKKEREPKVDVEVPSGSKCIVPRPPAPVFPPNAIEHTVGEIAPGPRPIGAPIVASSRPHKPLDAQKQVVPYSSSSVTQCPPVVAKNADPHQLPLDDPNRAPSMTTAYSKVSSKATLKKRVSPEKNTEDDTKATVRRSPKRTDDDTEDSRHRRERRRTKDEEIKEKDEGGRHVEEDDPDSIPPGWQQYTTDSGEIAYYNEATGETTWDKPLPVDLPRVPYPWRRFRTEDGHIAYQNDVTQETSWEFPKEAP